MFQKRVIEIFVKNISKYLFESLLQKCFEIYERLEILIQCLQDVKANPYMCDMISVFVKFIKKFSTVPVLHSDAK